MKYFFRLLILLFSLTSLLCCNSNPKDTKKGKDTLPVELIKAFNELAAKDLLNHNPKLALSTLNKLEGEFGSKENLNIQAFINSYKAKCYFVQFDLDSALLFNKSANAYFKNYQDVYLEQYVNSLQILALIYREKSDIIESKKYFEEIIMAIENNPEVYNDNLENLDFVGQVYGNYANLYGDEHEFNKARIYTKKAIGYLKLSKKNVNSLIIRNYLNLGVFFENENIDSALYYIKKGVFLTNPIDSVGKIRGLEYLGELFLHASQGDSALIYLNLAQSYSKKLNDLDEKMISNLLIRTYAILGNKKLANDYYEKTKEIILNSNQDDANFDDLLIIKKALTFAIDKNKYQDIKQLATFYNNLADTLYSQEKAIALKNLEVKYKVKSKDESIEKLKFENELKETQIKLRTIILLAFLLFGFLAYLFLKQRQLKQLNEKNELEHRFLRSQMNPHFMSNALSAIQVEIVNGNSKLANKYLNKYNELTRDIFENSRNKLVPIYKEVLVIENYLLLQKIRFDNKFEYNLNFYDDIEEDIVEIPPMLIQPSIENAIEHGFKNISYKGLVNIVIQKKENAIIATISDNGIGLKTEESLKSRKSLSSLITAERLKIYGKEIKKESHVKIANIIPHGVEVTITIPI